MCPLILPGICGCCFYSSKHNSSLSNERFRQSKLANLPPQAMKHLWIRTALIEKLLDKIVLYLVENSRYVCMIKYEPEQPLTKKEVVSLYKSRSESSQHFRSSFYEKEAMLMDPVDGPILASLLGMYSLHT